MAYRLGRALSYTACFVAPSYSEQHIHLAQLSYGFLFSLGIGMGGANVRDGGFHGLGGRLIPLVGGAWSGCKDRRLSVDLFFLFNNCIDR